MDEAAFVFDELLQTVTLTRRMFHGLPRIFYLRRDSVFKSSVIETAPFFPGDESEYHGKGFKRGTDLM